MYKKCFEEEVARPAAFVVTMKRTHDQQNTTPGCCLVVQGTGTLRQRLLGGNRRVLGRLRARLMGLLNTQMQESDNSEQQQHTMKESHHDPTIRTRPGKSLSSRAGRCRNLSCSSLGVDGGLVPRLGRFKFAGSQLFYPADYKKVCRHRIASSGRTR